MCRLNWPGRVSIIEVREATRQIVDCAIISSTSRETFFLAEPTPVTIGGLFSEMGRSIGATSAGSLRLPSWIWSLVRLGLPLAPFQLKCLLSDALVVSTKKVEALGVSVAARNEDYLVPLARYNANQLFPSRHAAPALITGAAGGIGACLARQLYCRGYPLLLADRNETELRARCSSYAGAQPWVVDLSNATLPEIFRTI